MKDPAFLFYSADFVVGVADLTMEERGQYITLLCLQHQHGHLSAKSICLACAVRMLSDIADVMAKFRQDGDGLYYNERLDIEMDKRLKYVDSRRSNAVKGAEKRLAYAPPYAEHMVQHSGDEDINENVPVIKDKTKSKNRVQGEGERLETEKRFEQFYQAYPKKRAKDDAKKAFYKIVMDDVLFYEIMDSLEKWKKCEEWKKDNGQFIPFPATWLNGKRWNDDIPILGVAKAVRMSESERIMNL